MVHIKIKLDILIQLGLGTDGIPSGWDSRKDTSMQI